MPLVTLHTRLFTLLNEANFVRQYASEGSAAMAAGPVSANAVVALAQRLQATLANVVTPLADDEGLVGYAAAQFSDNPNWVPLNLQIAGITSLVEAVISACKDCVPVDGDGYILKDVWNPDGSVSVRQLSTSDTADLRAALNTLASAIPE